MKSSVTPPKRKRTRAAVLLGIFALLATTVFMTAGPANASSPPAAATTSNVSASTTSLAALTLPLTKKCTTKLNGVSLPSYKVDSMFVTVSKYGNQYRYRVEHTPTHTVRVNLGNGSYRYYDHHIDNITMLATTTRVGKSVDFPGNVIYFYSTSPYRDFKMKAHVQEGATPDIFPTCPINF